MPAHPTYPINLPEGLSSEVFDEALSFIAEHADDPDLSCEEFAASLRSILAPEGVSEKALKDAARVAYERDGWSSHAELVVALYRVFSGGL